MPVHRDHDTIKWMLNQIGRVPLLTPEEEIHLGHLVAEWNQLKESTPEAEYTAKQKRIARRGERAHRRMVSANIRLVVSVARKYVHVAEHLHLEDLIQEGCIGLGRAVDKFDPTRGYKFSTYAYWWIRQAITRGMTTYERAIRLPPGVFESLSKVRQYMIDYSTMHNRFPSVQQIADHIEVGPERVKLLLQHYCRTVSLDQPVKALSSEKEKINISELIAEEDSNPEVALERQLAHQYIRDKMDDLSDVQKALLINKFFTDPEERKSQAQMADELEISRFTTSKQERVAMMQIRQAAAHDKYDMADVA